MFSSHCDLVLTDALYAAAPRAVGGPAVTHAHDGRWCTHESLPDLGAPTSCMRWLGAALSLHHVQHSCPRASVADLNGHRPAQSWDVGRYPHVFPPFPAIHEHAQRLQTRELAHDGRALHTLEALGSAGPLDRLLSNLRVAGTHGICTRSEITGVVPEPGEVVFRARGSVSLQQRRHVFVLRGPLVCVQESLRRGTDPETRPEPTIRPCRPLPRRRIDRVVALDLRNDCDQIGRAACRER